MKLKIIANNQLEQYSNKDYISEVYNIEYNEEDTLKNLKEALNIEYSSISFDKYYGCATAILMPLEDILPFIIRDNKKVEWEVDINTVLIKEFIDTHEIDLNEGIYLEYGYPQAGGPGLFGTILDLWVSAYLCLQIVDTLGGVAQFIEWVKNKFKNKIPHPHSVFDFIYKENKWNYIILSEKLDFDKEDVKYLLLALGYIWDNSQKLYCITEEMKIDKINKINKVNIFGLK
ncbi:MAG: hypothetical protein PHD15_06750 [Clostridia bacterium]|nr:hypothetical protein [Clostridia bacterium]MDD4387427.1 hypothetical protein [Clostridia bacterium]